METRLLRRALNGAKAVAAEKWVEKALETGHQFTQAFLEEQGWFVVPVESGQHFDSRDAERLASAATALGATQLRAVLLEELEQVWDHLEVDVTAEGLLLFSRQCAHFNFALLPDDHSFAVICTTDDYFLVAGPRTFVEIATGKEISSARADFDEFAGGESWNDLDRDRLRSVSQRYEESMPPSSEHRDHGDV